MATRVWGKTKTKSTKKEREDALASNKKKNTPLGAEITGKA